MTLTYTQILRITAQIMSHPTILKIDNLRELRGKTIWETMSDRQLFENIVDDYIRLLSDEQQKTLWKAVGTSEFQSNPVVIFITNRYKYYRR